MSDPYHRESELKERFNRFVTDKITGNSEDYYSKLSIEDFEDIKTTLRDIHNIITYRTTVRFIEWLVNASLTSGKIIKFIWIKY